MGLFPRFLGLRGNRLNIAIGIIAGLDFFLFGYDQGVTGGLLTLSAFLETFPEISINAAEPSRRSHVTNIQGITVASYNVGCFFGAIACIWIGDILGRRKTIFLGSAVMVVGAALQCSAFNLPHLIIGRIITGLGNGLNTSTVPAWQSETSKSHQRGKMVMIEGALITGGICLSYWIDYGFAYLDPSSVSWRFPLAFQIVFALIILIFIMELPESPRWLILRGKEDEALNVLGALSDLSTDDPYVRSEFSAIKDTVLQMAGASFKDCFTMDQNRHFHRTALAYVNQMFQQISGINLITYYASYIYEQQLHFEPSLARLLGAANGTEYFIASWIPVFTVEKFGRRQLMLFGAVGMACTMAILAGTASLGSQAGGIATVVFLFVFNTFFAIGWLGMTWLYPAEIVPLRIRAPANALSTSANWAFNFMVVMVTPVAFNSIGYQTYIIFAVINAFIVPCVYFFYPETMGRSLEEMDTIFHKTTNVFNVVALARDEPRRYGKNGELLINYDELEEHRRRSSVAGGAANAAARANNDPEKAAFERKTGSDNSS